MRKETSWQEQRRTKKTQHATESREECSELPSMLVPTDGGSLSLRTLFVGDLFKIAFIPDSKVRTTPMSMSQVKFDFRVTYVG